MKGIQQTIYESFDYLNVNDYETYLHCFKDLIVNYSDSIDTVNVKDGNTLRYNFHYRLGIYDNYVNSYVLKPSDYDNFLKTFENRVKNLKINIKNIRK